MRLCVLVKQSVNVYELKIDSKTLEPLLVEATYTIGDIDRNALEEAVRLKEKFGGTVVAVSVGPEKAESELRRALAAGADEAHLVVVGDLRSVDTRMTSKLLATLIKKLGEFDLILCGELSVDGLSGQIGPRVAELLGLPVVTHVRRILELDPEKREIVVERDAGDAYEVVKTSMPCVLTVTREINTPRIPTLKDILRARRKLLKKYSPEDLGLTLAKPGVSIVETKAPRVERKRVVIKEESVDAAVSKLIEYLRKEGVI